MDGVFITGTDTGVGKTIVCAGILKLLLGTKKAVYWKPIQTGTIVGDDTKAVKSLTDLKTENFWDPAYRFPEPLSPHMAAQKWGKTIDMETVYRYYDEHKKKGTFVIIEGAGGILVPLTDTVLQIHMIKRFGLPLILVSEDRVGAINQTLLTLNAAREAQLPVLGVVLTRARKTLGNAEAISKFGKVEILAEFDPTEDSRSIVGQVGANERLRKLFEVDSLPS